MKTHNNPSPAPIWDSRNSDEPPRMRIRCENHDYYLKPDGCPMCRALKAEAELESLRQENNRLRFQLHIILDQKEAELKRLREALGAIASDGEFIRDCSPMHLAMIANRALNPPKRS